MSSPADQGLAARALAEETARRMQAAKDAQAAADAAERLRQAQSGGAQ